MSKWNLSEVLSSLHDGIQHDLNTARKTLAHPGTKGDASETVWLGLLQTYLPKRYQVESAHVVDSEGNFSDQMDVVVFDRQYSPRLLSLNTRYQIGHFSAKNSLFASNWCKLAISKPVVRALNLKKKPIRDQKRRNCVQSNLNVVF